MSLRNQFISSGSKHHQGTLCLMVFSTQITRLQTELEVVAKKTIVVTEL